jgi:hypothetical protein
VERIIDKKRLFFIFIDYLLYGSIGTAMEMLMAADVPAIPCLA